jgi:hypothetical protein
MPMTHYPGADEPEDQRPLIDAAIWDVKMLLRMLTDCRVFSRPDPEFPGEAVIYPPEQTAVIVRLIDLICAGRGRGVEKP